MASSSSSSALPARPQIPAARTCLCSPTTHPGSFRCSLHRNARKINFVTHRPPSHANVAAVSSDGALDSSLRKSLRAILQQIIRPSNRSLHRRRNFNPKPSRFFVMNGTNNDSGVTVA